VDEFAKPQEQAQATRQAMEEAGLTLSAVWMRYFSFTGAAGEYEIDAYLNGSLELPAHERDLVSHAVNELIKELPPRRMAPYSPNGKRPGPGPKPTHDGARGETADASQDGHRDGTTSPSHDGHRDGTTSPSHDGHRDGTTSPSHDGHRDGNRKARADGSRDRSRGRPQDEK